MSNSKQTSKTKNAADSKNKTEAASQIKKDWDSTRLMKFWNNGLPKRFIKQINWHKHDARYMSLFLMLAAISAGLIYISYARVENLNYQTQANVYSTTAQSNNVKVIINSNGRQNVYSAQLANKQSSMSVVSIFRNLASQNLITMKTALNNGYIILTELNGQPNVTNRKAWKIYINNEKITKTIDIQKVKGGDQISLVFE
jgi:hypothetical protein